MGYGVIQTTGKKAVVLSLGVLKLDKYDDYALKLKKIFERTVGLIDEYHPDELAIEAPFYGKNVQSMLKLGRAQGVAIVLGPEAKIAWEQAGCQRLYFGTRIVATRLKLLDATNRSLDIFLVSSYAPDSSRPSGEHEEFEMHKQWLLLQ